ncbi:uncharacterized protein [Embiotoca jacksoni]|uniref:uncharacterized protein isoform X2 n=1 Tax=Embiotoca jacksoni TaxID=100190 RepID=UPI003704331F
MRGKAKRKVVTSGRLTGAVAVSRTPEPAYSLYSTDSEDQVTTLHRGLDRCAALLSDILEADQPVSPRTVKAAAGKSRLSTSRGKKTIRKLPAKTAPGPQRSTAAAAHSGVKLHPPQRRPHTKPPPQTFVPPPKTTPPPPQTSVLLSVRRSSSPHTLCDGQEECVPVRDTHSQINTCSRKTSGVQLEAGRHEDVPEDARSWRGDGGKTVRGRITGDDSAAERLQTVSSAHMNVGRLNIQTESEPDLSSLQSQNAQLRRRVRTLNQQLKEREKVEQHHNLEMLCNTQVVILQEELLTSRSRLQDVQQNLTELQEVLQDTRRRLRDTEEENTLMKTDLEDTRRRLVNVKREKNEMTSLAQQRLEEMENLHRLLQSRRRPDSPPVVVDIKQHVSQDAAAPPTDLITRYLMSLGPPEEACDAEETAGRPGQRERRQLFERSPTDAVSAWSECSLRSGTTFDTRDEAAFRDGLAALDARIESLQRNIQLDLRR